MNNNKRTVSNNQSEKIISQLKAAGSLERRFAKIEDIKLIWSPKSKSIEKVPTSGVFSHLVPKNANPLPQNVQTPIITMTWKKFHEVVLPRAEKVEFLACGAKKMYIGLITAVDMEAPPILQWDTMEQRNPVSWYLYSGGSFPSTWNLNTGEFVPVTGICFRPSMWYGKRPHHGQGAVFILKGAKDLRYTAESARGNALFPKILKSEFHPIRKTIEAYSNTAQLHGISKASACGVLMSTESNDLTFRVTSNGFQSRYKLDRWD